MKTYEITLNDKTYIVKAREIDSAEIPKQVTPSTPVSATAATSGQGCKVTAPVAGLVLDIKVSIGMPVKKGQILCILEAMKMENEIIAPQDGTVTAIHVSKNQQIESGIVMIEM